MRQLIRDPGILPLRFASTAAFLAWEDEQEERHEFIDGMVWAMPGGTRGHSIVSGNVFAFVHGRLRGSPCRPHGGEYRVRAPDGEIMYPDAWVRCGEKELLSTEATDPVIAFEVLSPSTRRKDLVEKRRIYQQFPSLRHFGFIEPDRVFVEHVRRSRGSEPWSSEEFDRLEQFVDLTVIDVRLPLAAIYEGVFSG